MASPFTPASIPSTGLGSVIVNTADTPSAGEVLTATSATAADWEPTGAIPATLFDAKGDIIAASAADTAARVAVGSNQRVLTADSSQSAGVAWSLDGRVLLATQTLGVAGTFDFQTIDQSYTHLQILVICRATNTTATLGRMTFNGDTSAAYTWEFAPVSGTSTPSPTQAGTTIDSAFQMPLVVGTNDTANCATLMDILIPWYTLTTFHHTHHTRGVFSIASNGNQAIYHTGGRWAATTAIANVQILPTAGSTFVAGSVAKLYGLT